MPELPEVESICRSLEPIILGETVTDLLVYNDKLRWPVMADISSKAKGLTIKQIVRRAKYLLMVGEEGALIWHFGMSGSLRVASSGEERRRHDHIELLFGDGVVLRFYDPRRFGSLHWGGRDPFSHSLLANLGVEPLSAQFTGSYLAAHCAQTTVSIKGLLLKAAVVVGVGNIYASEALFRAGVNPSRSACSLSSDEIERVCEAVRAVLAQAIQSGGTTLRDYVNGKGEPGSFKDCLLVYGKDGEPCSACSAKICRSVISNRSSFFCPHCQPPPLRSL